MKKKEKRYGLLKGIILMLVFAIILTWLIPTGEFSASGFATENTLARVGLNDLGWIVRYGIFFNMDKIIFLLVLGGFYGVLTKISAYDRLVTNIANKLTNKKVAVVIFSCLIAALTSVLTEVYAVLLFVPFIISILNKMKLDKMTILSTTFGSMLVGVMGATYGTDGMIAFAESIMGTGTLHDVLYSSILIRLGILVIGLVLFNFFTLKHMNKNLKVEKSDMFLEESTKEEKKETKKSSMIPLVVIGILTIIITILGFVSWNTNFNITIFDSFHESVQKIAIGEDFFIFKSLLGGEMGAFGTWMDMFSVTPIILLFTIILGLCYRIKLDDFFDSFKNGAKKMIKPILIVVAAWSLLTIVYMAPVIATVINKLLSDKFNLATMSLTALISNIFHTDLGFSGYLLGAYLNANFADYINSILVIFTSLYGFIQFFIPTSIFLGIGLVSTDVKYTDWLKHIWKFLLGMLICLLVIFILITII